MATAKKAKGANGPGVEQMAAVLAAVLQHRVAEEAADTVSEEEMAVAVAAAVRRALGARRASTP